ncbi:MAG: hypothetical protein MZV65_38255 [Chromatiales bacterium]|nr:hypothetical protein [Chromatiales bacterium]
MAAGSTVRFNASPGDLDLRHDERQRRLRESGGPHGHQRDHPQLLERHLDQFRQRRYASLTMTYARLLYGKVAVLSLPGPSSRAYTITITDSYIYDSNLTTNHRAGSSPSTGRPLPKT